MSHPLFTRLVGPSTNLVDLSTWMQLGTGWQELERILVGFFWWIKSEWEPTCGNEPEMAMNHGVHVDVWRENNFRGSIKLQSKLESKLESKRQSNIRFPVLWRCWSSHSGPVDIVAGFKYCVRSFHAVLGETMRPFCLLWFWVLGFGFLFLFELCCFYLVPLLFFVSFQFNNGDKSKRTPAPPVALNHSGTLAK